MKLHSVVLAAFLASSVEAAESGLRDQDLAVPAPAQARRKLGGVFPEWFFGEELPTAPEMKCESDLSEPYADTEFIVAQYGDALNSTCLDLEDVDTQAEIAKAFCAAYLDVDSTCTQAGAFCEANSAEFVAQSMDSSTILIKTTTNCNAGTFLNSDESCGIDLFEGDIPVTFSRRLEAETCFCPRPTAADVLSKFNMAIAETVSKCPEVTTAWAVAIEQYCPLGCSGAEYTFSADGVVPPCEDSEYPSEYPSEFPTDTDSPTGTDAPTESPTVTDAPTIKPTVGPTFSPTAPFTIAPSAPFTIAPSAEDTV